MKPSVTIVVPVYDHWSSLARCIRSVRAHAPADAHVIVVNDNGPHADTIEELLLAEIDDDPRFEYHRNPTNLGFVRTCNRAATELDDSDAPILLLNADAEVTRGAIEEMLAVLNIDEHHAAVCPRSDNASIATIPLARRNGAPEKLSPSDGDAIARAVTRLLPRYTLAPVAVGFAMLIRRSLIRNHGLFDEIYGRGYNEENDFCMRVNELGYSCVLANRAWVRHLGSVSFVGIKNQLDEMNAGILSSRYPHYFPTVSRFERFGRHAIDRFAEVIANLPGSEPSVLIDIHHLSHVHNGSTRFALALLEWLRDNRPEGVKVAVAAQPGTIEFFRLDRFGFPVRSWDDETEVFDVGVAVAPVNSFAQLAKLNRRCARWVVCHFDMIAARSNELLSHEPKRAAAVGLGLRHADRVVAISESSLADAATFFPVDAPRIREHGIGVRIGATTDVSDFLEVSVDERAHIDELTRDPYVLVVGNHFPHKQVATAIRALKGTGTRLIAFGPVAGVSSTEEIAILPSGGLSSQSMSDLQTRATVVLFPSAYEGFGLPLVEALDHGTPVIVFDSSITHEIVDATGAADAVRFFTAFDELPQLVHDVLGDEKIRAAAASLADTMPGMDEYTERLWGAVMDVLGTPLDTSELEARWRTITTIEEFTS